MVLGSKKNGFKMSLMKFFEVMSAPKYWDMLVRRGLALCPTEIGIKCV